jgi:hypothetical protein
MIELGDEVQDTITGFKGIAIARHTYLQGCDRISVQPKVNKEGKNQDSVAFDEPQLKVIKPKAHKRDTTQKPGGVAEHIPGERTKG